MNEAEIRVGQIDTASRHFAAFMSLARVDPEAVANDGKPPFDWAPKDIPGRDRLPNHRLSRPEVYALVDDPSASIDAVCWAILAWGGMHNSNRDHLRSVADRSWLDLAEAIRAGYHDRRSAYEAFALLRSREGKKLSGMRPAYFTKLIFFLMPRGPGRSQPGYIMDQWAGCSVNLLANRKVVLMDCNGRWHSTRSGPLLKWDHHVSDANDDTRYDDYCGCIEALARETGTAPDATERMLLAGKRNQRDTWRHYVTVHHAPPGTFRVAA